MQTPSPDNTCANDVIDSDVTDNDVIYSWMNMHTLVLQVGQMWSRRRARCERGLTLPATTTIHAALARSRGISAEKWRFTSCVRW